MSVPYYADATVTVHHGDCLDVLRELPDASVDAVVTDPPYGLEFMGKEWDAPWKDSTVKWDSRGQGAERGYVGKSRAPVGGFSAYKAGAPFQAWCQLWAAECLRVLRPGGHLVAAGGSRTFHRMVSGVEDAGFEIRDTITWHFASGFPKSRNVSKDLAGVPPCTCDISGHLRAIDTRCPPGAVGASVGTVAGTVPLAGGSADQTNGVGPQVIPATPGRVANVDTLDMEGGRHGLPEVLGLPPVAGDAQGSQVGKVIGGLEVDPESLRDHVMSEQPVCSAAVSASPVALDDSSGDARPAPSLVLPLTTPPRRVAGSLQPNPIGDGHTGAGAVDGDVCPPPELVTADGADMDAVPGSLHGVQSTAERLTQCQACGGRRGVVPSGLGTALKPATEFFVVARKPLSGTVAATVLAHGTGALNVDGCRVAGVEDTARPQGKDIRGGNWSGDGGRSGLVTGGTSGRWPANVVLDESQAEVLDAMSGTQRDGVAVNRNKDAQAVKPHEVYGEWLNGDLPDRTYGGQGGASRYFYTAKAASSERIRLDGTAHPTVKPLSLMRWLVRLVCPPGGTVLEPFAGSGTTVEACILEGFRCIAVEREADYLPLITQRIHRRRDPAAFVKASGGDGGLFDLLDVGEVTA